MSTTEFTGQRLRRLVVVAASTLAVSTLAAVAPAPVIVAASAASPASASTTAGQVSAEGAVTVLAVAPSTSLRSPAAAKPVVRTIARSGVVVPFRVGTARYNQWWARTIMIKRYQWKSSGQYICLVKLWNRESHWNHRAHNSRSGAHGIPQALPGSKMRSAGSDWRTNAITQIRWGLGYVHSRYSTPCGAWSHFRSHGWY